MSDQPLAFRNGQFIPQSELAVSYADAGFVTAATVTDFCRTYHQKLFRWPEHLARFRRDCDDCCIPLTFSDAELTAAAGKLIDQNRHHYSSDTELALITFATPGPMAYMTGLPENGPPTLAMHTLRLSPERYRRFFDSGVTLALAGIQPSAQFPIVPAHAKHRSRLHWWLAEQAVRDPNGNFYAPGAVPVLVDQNGGFPDTPIGSVLGISPKGYLIALPSDGVLDSITVQVVKELCPSVGVAVGDLPSWDIGVLFQPDREAFISEMLLVGSGFGIASVREFLGPGNRKCTFEWPGPITMKLQQAFSDLVGKEIRREFI